MTVKGELFILSAPSGSGKTSLIRGMLEGGLADFGDLAFSISHTTRPPRQGEVGGIDYHFVELPVFQEMIANERFLEWAEVHNNYYGTAFEEVLPHLEQGTDVLLDIDVQGAERVLGRYPEAHGIFIMPPSYDSLRERLEGRGLDDDAEISRRLAVSLWEVKRYGMYSYVIINDDLERASNVLASIILEKRHRLARMREVTEGLLKDFVRP